MSTDFGGKKENDLALYGKMRKSLLAEDWMGIDAFVQDGGDLNSIRDFSGKSLVWHAAADGRYSHMDALLARGALAEEALGGLLLHGKPDDGQLSRLLAKNPDPRKAIEISGWKPPLRLACARGWVAAARGLLEMDARLATEGESAGESPMFDLLRDFRAEIADMLLAAGASLAATSGKQKNGLPHQAVYWRSLEGLHWLRNAGANLDMRNALGETPLLRAAWLGRQEICEFLLSAGVDPNAKDRKGKTPLFAAIAGGKSGIAQMLLAAGADPQAKSGKNGQGRSPLALAGKGSAGADRKSLLMSLESAAMDQAVAEPTPKGDRRRSGL